MFALNFPSLLSNKGEAMTTVMATYYYPRATVPISTVMMFS